MEIYKKIAFNAIIWLAIGLIVACSGPSRTNVISPPISRESRIPAGAVRMSPETDQHPPVLLSGEYEEPIPVPGEVNTAGGEDSPFITHEGNKLYFFFTPDVTIPAERQLSDGVTGIYVSTLVDGVWGKPERILLQESGKQALDGCEFVLGEIMWFCSTREGYSGINWFSAAYQNGKWGNWRPVELNPDYQVGELHISLDGSQLYFASTRPGGKGQMDIWVSSAINGEWQEPINVLAVNTADSEGWPALSPDGNELWFYRNYGIWRSRKVNGEWQEAEQILSSLAGEPTVDVFGNLYFVHHYFSDDVMIEADIYVAYKKQ